MTCPCLPVRLLPLLLLLAALLAPGAAPARAQGGDPSGPRAVVDDYQVFFQPQGDWGTGFVADVVIANRGAAPVVRWRLEFEFDRAIDSIWNARVVQRSGRHYVVEG